MAHVKVGSTSVEGKRRDIINNKDLITHWFVTVVETEHDSPDEDMCEKSKRCWGYEDTFEKAEEAVVNNYTGIRECSYQWAIIEEYVMSYFAMPTGLFQWYHWDEDSENI